MNAATTVSSLLSKFAAATPWPPRPETRYSCADDLFPNPPEVIISIQSSSSDNSSYRSCVISLLGISPSEIDLRILKYAVRSSEEALTCLITAIETTLSSGASLIPLTPVESLPLNTLTSVVGKRIALPRDVVSKKSSYSVAIRTLTIETPSGNFIAILPFDFTLVKSDNAFLLTPPASVANTICRLPHSSSGASIGIKAAIETPGSIGRMLTIALPFAFRPPRGRRQVLSL